MCLFCLLETTSLNKFMKSLLKSEYWHFKISWKHCQENFQFSRRDFFGLHDFDISARSYLKSRRVFGRWDLGENIDKILRSCQESLRGFGRWDFKISPRSQRESRRDFEISPRSRRESRRLFGCWDFEISPRSRQSRRPKTRRDLGQNFAGVVPVLWKNKLNWLLPLFT